MYCEKINYLVKSKNKYLENKNFSRTWPRLQKKSISIFKINFSITVFFIQGTSLNLLINWVARYTLSCEKKKNLH